MCSSSLQSTQQLNLAGTNSDAWPTIHFTLHDVYNLGRGTIDCRSG